MPIPDFDDEGLLPEGLHLCTLDEVLERFGQFNVSDRRVALGAQLRRYCEHLRAISFRTFLVVDGSFVTATEEPGDVDLLLVVGADADLAPDLLPQDYNAISKRQVRRHYEFDLLVAPEKSDAYQRHLEFFMQVKGRPERRKGLLKVVP